MLREMARMHPRLLATAIAGASVFGLMTVVSSMVVQWVVDNVVLPRFEEGRVAGGTVATGALLILVIGFLRAGAVVVRRVWAGRNQFRVAETLTNRVIDTLVRQPMPWHGRRPDGDLVARASVDTDTAISVLAPIPFATGTVVLLVVSAIWLVLSDGVLGGVAVLLFPVFLGVNIVYQRRASGYYHEAQDHLGRLSAGIHESFDGVQLVKAYGAEHREAERLSAIAGSLRDTRIRAVYLRGTFEAMLDVIPSLANLVIVALGAVRVRDGHLTVGELSSMVYLFTLLVMPLRLIGYVLSDLPHSLAGWNRVTEITNEPVEPDPREAIATLTPPPALAVRDLSFTYPGDQRAALDGIDLAVQPRSVVAVVGATGSGKSTLAEVVAGLLPATSGTIARAEGRHTMVFQEAFLFSGTIRENLTLGQDVADDEVWTALELASGAEFVAETPNGLDTVVGERGVSLSGGQRQRLALARAFVRRPDLLVLDDTTSALDPTTEARVLTNMRQAFGEAAVLMVASRPSTIRLADEVVFLDGGRLIAYGAHDHLVATVAGYRALVEAFETDRAVDEAEAEDAAARRPGSPDPAAVAP